MRVFIVCQTISFGDGIGNDILGLHKILDELKIENYIYGVFIDPRVKNKATPFSKLKNLCKDDVIIFEYGSLSPILNDVLAFDCIKILRYQNVTPPHFFGYDANMYRFLNNSLIEIQNKLNAFDMAMPASEFSKQDLIKMGFKKPIEPLPCIIPLGDYDNNVNTELEHKLEDGVTNILFTGRIAPNKKIEDIIRTFAFYHSNINPNSRLTLIGGFIPEDAYYQNIVKYLEEIGLDSINLAGRMSFKDIKTYYKTADLFLCMSEHEGYCIPIVEAMSYRVPILAFSSCAVPQTLGEGGILFDDKNIASVAEQMDIIINDEQLRKQILINQEEKIKSISEDSLKDQLLAFFDKYINSGLIKASEQQISETTIKHDENHLKFTSHVENSLSEEYYDALKAIKRNDEVDIEL